MSKIKSMYHDVPIGRLIEDAISYFSNQGFSEKTITAYRNILLHVKHYMDKRNIEFYTPSVGEKFLNERFKDLGISISEKWAYKLSMLVRRLDELYETGIIQKRTKLSPSFESALGQSVKGFLYDKISKNRFSKYTIKQDTYYLSIFIDYANKNELKNLTDLQIEKLNSFLGSLPQDKRSLRHHIIRTLRLYLSYLYNNSLIKINLSRLLPRDAYIKEAKLPSIYSKEEIEHLCSSIDRKNALGKRNYAIIMLLSRYGLRVSDICGLLFENIHWEECLIIINQYKTKEKVELPLTPEIGEALIDYLRNGRPKCNNTHVFVKGISPFTSLTPTLVSNIVTSSFRQAHIDTTGRKHGAHVLRHSLASLLLRQEVSLPVITGILGHKDSNSTKEYLRIDLEGLRKCAIEVPEVSKEFYNQNGGEFYE